MISTMLTSTVRSSIARSARHFSSSPAARDVARMTLVGRLGQDITRQTSVNGREYARYTVAVRQGRDAETSWYHVVCFDSNLDYLVDNFKKGTTVYVEAGASLQPFETADGRKIGSLQLIQRTIQRISRPTRDQEQEVERAEDEASA